MEQTITDDLGFVWRFTGDRIRVDGDDTPDDEGGYPCYSLARGVRVLEEYGYITPTTARKALNAIERAETCG